MNNQRGVVTTEFIFAFVIAGGLFALLFSVCYSLAVVSVTQYVSFSASRAHMAGNKDPQAQIQAARDKYAALIEKGTAIGSLYQGTWFEIASPDQIEIRGGRTAPDSSTFGDTLGGGSEDPTRPSFMGVSVPLTIKLLRKKLPLLGSTTEADEEENSFQTRLNSMLIREPSQQECVEFFNRRRDALGGLPSSSRYYKPSDYVPMEDNGC